MEKPRGELFWTFDSYTGALRLGCTNGSFHGLAEGSSTTESVSQNALCLLSNGPQKRHTNILGVESNGAKP